ncbi:MAG: NAD(P)H-dependent oxidoreductase [Blautia sp.]|nr:NAD(P)H-dependent oxidoreductase [Blautia sp.]
MILFINACVRENSRTKRLADHLLSKMHDRVEEIRLEDCSFPAVDEAFLQKRDQLIAEGEFDAPLFKMARQFAEADRIVIGAPYWDLSFPASLKQYFEQINVLGITFMYTPEGFPEGMCRADKLFYVMTAGGMYVPEEFGFGYVKALAQNFYGIKDVELIKAVGLDIDGADAEKILDECIRKYDPDCDRQ